MPSKEFFFISLPGFSVTILGYSQAHEKKVICSMTVLSLPQFFVLDCTWCFKYFKKLNRFDDLNKYVNHIKNSEAIMARDWKMTHFLRNFSGVWLGTVLVSLPQRLYLKWRCLYFHCSLKTTMISPLKRGFFTDLLA